MSNINCVPSNLENTGVRLTKIFSTLNCLNNSINTLGLPRALRANNVTNGNDIIISDGDNIIFPSGDQNISSGFLRLTTILGPPTSTPETGDGTLAFDSLNDILYIYSDNNNRWLSLNTSSGMPDLATVLSQGNISGGNDIIMTNGDSILNDNVGDLILNTLVSGDIVLNSINNIDIDSGISVTIDSTTTTNIFSDGVVTVSGLANSAEAIILRAVTAGGDGGILIRSELGTRIVNDTGFDTTLVLGNTVNNRAPPHFRTEHDTPYTVGPNVSALGNTNNITINNCNDMSGQITFDAVANLAPNDGVQIVFQQIYPVTGQLLVLLTPVGANSASASFYVNTVTNAFFQVLINTAPTTPAGTVTFNYLVIHNTV